MRAMVLEGLMEIRRSAPPLRMIEVPKPVPQSREVLIRVSACGVCHTELDEIEGRAPPTRFPAILGHQIVGEITTLGDQCTIRRCGDRVGVGWIYSACEHCAACRTGCENLCPEFQATGRDVPGGYAEYVCALEDFTYLIPDSFSNVEAAPLLCAGAIGYRSLRLAALQDGEPLGLTGYGASAQLVLALARQVLPNSPVYVFARRDHERVLAIERGAVWAGDTREKSPCLLKSVIDTTPAWTPVVAALSNLIPGGRLVINAIRKEEADKSVLAELDYPRDIWMEKEIKSVANVTRRDIREFLEIAASREIRPIVSTYPLSEANAALFDLKEKHVEGAKVLTISH
jgi:alcohol dehydrogenase, propanol-preferring